MYISVTVSHVLCHSLVITCSVCSIIFCLLGLLMLFGLMSVNYSYPHSVRKLYYCMFDSWIECVVSSHHLKYAEGKVPQRVNELVCGQVKEIIGQGTREGAILNF